jgi:hypothetical protein
MNKVLKISIIVVLCLIVILAVTLILTQCQSKKPPEETTTTTTTTPTTTTTTKPPVSCTHVDADYNGICDLCEEEVESIFTPVDDVVYVIATELNVRKTPEVPEDVYSNVFCSKYMNDELKRTGYNADWTRIEIDGASYYVSTETVTTEKPITNFEDRDETVYFIHSANAYTKPSHLNGYSEVIDTFQIGESVKRTGVATEVYNSTTDGKSYTFARIEYTVTLNGEETTQISYVNNDYLTTEAPADPDAGIVFEESSVLLKVIADTSISLRKSALWVEGDKEFNDSQIDGTALKGDLLQATHKGTESDGTIWYKVVVNDVTHYVIYNATRLEIQTPAEQ